VPLRFGLLLYRRNASYLLLTSLCLSVYSHVYLLRSSHAYSCVFLILLLRAYGCVYLLSVTTSVQLYLLLYVAVGVRLYQLMQRRQRTRIKQRRPMQTEYAWGDAKSNDWMSSVHACHEQQCPCMPRAAMSMHAMITTTASASEACLCLGSDLGSYSTTTLYSYSKTTVRIHLRSCIHTALLLYRPILTLYLYINSNVSLHLNYCKSTAKLL